MADRMEDRVTYQLARTDFEMRMVLDHAIGEHGITMPQWMVLRLLAGEPGLSTADIARRSFIPPQAVAGIVQKLEAGKMVTRSPHPSHGRIQAVTVTAAGREAARRCDRRIKELETRLATALGTEAATSLKQNLSRCRRVFADFGAAKKGRGADKAEKGDKSAEADLD